MRGELLATNDPREQGVGDQTFDPVPYLGGTPTHPDFKRPGKGKTKGKRKGKK